MDTVELPDRVSVITLEGRQIYLVGTAHVSKESVEDVRKTVAQVKPDTICVELCASRHKTLTQKDVWRKMDIFKVIKEKKAMLLLAQLIMSAFYRRLGEKLGVQPGAEMLEGVALAADTDARLVLADRDIQITLKRVWGYLGFRTKMKLVNYVLVGIFTREEIDASMIETLKEKEQLERIMAEFAKHFPEIKERLIDERDVFLAQKIREAGGKTIVAIVGAGHCEGIRKQIHQDQSLEELNQLPPKSVFWTLMKWGIPLVLVLLIAYGFYFKGSDHTWENIWIWFLFNGVLSAVGTIIALGHPAAVLSAFLAAPFTSLSPFMAAGWVAGVVQAFVRRPTVDDFEDLPNAIGSVRGFWTNPASRVLLVVCLANAGSIIGGLISGGIIGVRTIMEDTPVEKEVLVPVADGIEEIEAVSIIDTLRRAEADVTVASVGKEEVTASRGVRLVADTTVERCADREFDLIVLPGGMPGASHLAQCQPLVTLLRRQQQAGKLYAAICAAPAVVLMPHGLLDKVKATCYPSMLAQLDAAFRSEERVVVDGNCVTAQGPGVALPFALALVEQLYGREKRETLAEQMLVA